ncbi:MAG: DUF1737 domain-containing protein [Mycobacteriaceae bacterium]
MSEGKLRYRLLTGPDDHAFCERVSAALADGWRLHGSPAATVRSDDQVIVAQAVVRDGGTDEGDTDDRGALR